MSAAPVPPIPPDRDRWLPPEPPPQRPPKRQSGRRVLLWVGVGELVLILLLVASVILILKSNRVHQYILNVAEQKATASLGTRLNVGNYALHFSGISPTLDLYSVTVYGAP